FSKATLSFWILQPDEECNIITLGIGSDTKVENELKQTVSSTCKFSGADPTEEVNRELYEVVGKYHKLAVGAANDVHNASILGCKFTLVINQYYVSLIVVLHTFLKEFFMTWNKLSQFDAVSYFLPDGILDSAGITVCQWTCEFHPFVMSPANLAKLETFLWSTLRNGK
ncbi:unnamed protein product, partial [Enterobius vermicularis]|uniref:Dynein_AAA_lid domain-containing protein n=1 Tax=Enterobius vermicularis TaxID=51028 RepID=A0A0N4V6P2_ENTVE